MTKHIVLAIVAAALFPLLISQANAFNLTNRDVADQRILVSEGSAEPMTRNMLLGSNQTIDGLSQKGCTITLQNSGFKKSFEGTRLPSFETAIS